MIQKYILQVYILEWLINYVKILYLENIFIINQVLYTKLVKFQMPNDIHICILVIFNKKIKNIILFFLILNNCYKMQNCGKKIFKFKVKNDKQSKFLRIKLSDCRN